MATWRRPRRPVVPGLKCPAERSNKVLDRAVKITGLGKGLRQCGTCGRLDVPVQQGRNRDGHAVSAWYYSEHTVPTRTVSTTNGD